ncbi:MAG: alpha/beta fold hydrolase, partial [Spirochaetaceae bacterium]|nr:alpha/beta fold hydrolase [Spirochaetaceae bacterium]
MKKYNKIACRVRRCALPIEYSAGNSRVVLCLHGFTGYPGEMAYPAKRLLDAGWDVKVPRLSGHGTCGDDFRKNTVADWRKQISEEWKNLDARYDEVCVLGHSMGGLMALDLAIGYPVGKIAIMAPLLGIRKPGMFLFKPLSLIIEKRSHPWKTDPSYKYFDERDEDDEA